MLSAHCSRRSLHTVRHCTNQFFSEYSGYFSGKNERDMALMYHEFGVESGSGRKEKLTSTFMGYGEPGGTTIMAKTVGLTAAVGVELVLEDQLGSGVLTPMMPSVYKPGLEKLEGEGIIFTETHTVL